MKLRSIFLSFVTAASAQQVRNIMRGLYKLQVGFLTVPTHGA